MMDITTRVFRYEDLDDFAASQVFRAWVAQGGATQEFYRALDDLQADMYRTIGGLASLSFFNNEAYVTFDTLDFFEVIDQPTSIEDFESGFSCDVCDAFNAHTGKLDDLKSVCFYDSDIMDDMPGAFIYEVIDHQSQYVEEYSLALEDAAKVYADAFKDLRNDFNGEGAREVWNNEVADIETYGRWYDVNGRNVTAAVNLILDAHSPLTTTFTI